MQTVLRGWAAATLKPAPNERSLLRKLLPDPIFSSKTSPVRKEQHEQQTKVNKNQVLKKKNAMKCSIKPAFNE
jgi:hypothetical protein